MRKCLIYLDNNNFQNIVDLLEVARQMYCGNEKYETYLLCINGEDQNEYSLFDFIIKVKDERIQNHDIINITNCIEELHGIYDFHSILISATEIGRMLAPRAAMRLSTGLVADVTGINNYKETIEMIRPAFDGKLFAGIVNRNSKPIMMSIRPSVFRYGNEVTRNILGKIIEFHPKNIQKSTISLVEVKEKEINSDIRESKVLVSGGGGVSEKFDKLQSLADELNGMISASRRIVDSGIASRNIQVGQSGKAVSPKLYIALGIYGSLQHIEGLKNVENIISVNINKDAPICSLSDIVVEGDAIEFISKLVNKIKENKGEKV